MATIFILLLTIISMHILVQYLIQSCKKEETKEIDKPHQGIEAENQEAQESQGIENRDIQELQTMENQVAAFQLQLERIDDAQDEVDNEDIVVESHEVENLEAKESEVPQPLKQ